MLVARIDLFGRKGVKRDAFPVLLPVDHVHLIAVAADPLRITLIVQFKEQRFRTDTEILPELFGMMLPDPVRRFKELLLALDLGEIESEFLNEQIRDIDLCGFGIEVPNPLDANFFIALRRLAAAAFRWNKIRPVDLAVEGIGLLDLGHQFPVEFLSHLVPLPGNGCKDRCGGSGLIDMVKACYDHLLRHLDAVLLERGDQPQCHMVVCADKGIRHRLFAGCPHLRFHGCFIEFVTEVDFLLQRQAVILEGVLGSHLPDDALLVSFDAADKHHVFDAVFLDQVVGEFKHPVVVVRSDKRHALLRDLDTDHRNALLVKDVDDPLALVRNVERVFEHDRAIIEFGVRQVENIQTALALDGVLCPADIGRIDKNIHAVGFGRFDEPVDDRSVVVAAPAVRKNGDPLILHSCSFCKGSC